MRLAELMGGGISVKSTKGVGSSFTLSLPFACSGVDEAMFETPDVIPSWEGTPLRILFAEDNPINSVFGVSLLEKLGHEVVAVENGRDCLAVLEQGPFDLVLMDVQMPFMTGEEALFEIRKKEQRSGCHQAVIALTAYALREEKERFLQEGFDGYISKPLAINELAREIKRVLVR
jgi:CheY-like chemotaxis protein